MYTGLLREEEGKPPSWAEERPAEVYVAFLEQRGVSCGQRGTEKPRGRKRQREGLEAVSQGSRVPVKEFVWILEGVWQAF